MDAHTSRSDTTMSLREVQEALGVSRRTVYAWADKKLFPCLGVGNKVIVNRELFMRWYEEQSAPVVPEPETADAA